jgi:hypothetical protein
LVTAAKRREEFYLPSVRKPKADAGIGRSVAILSLTSKASCAYCAVSPRFLLPPS